MTEATRIIVKNLTRFTEQIVTRLTVESVANLQETPQDGGTPIDTGWARANWVPQIGTPRTDTVGSRESAEAGSVNQAASQGGLARVVGTYRLVNGPVFISNNVPYIVFLNAGTSPQAQPMFVERAIERAVRSVVGRPPSGGAARAEITVGGPTRGGGVGRDGRARDERGRFI